MDPNAELEELYALDFSEPPELALRMLGSLAGAGLVYAYAGWWTPWVWIGGYSVLMAGYWVLLRRLQGQATLTSVRVVHIVYLITLAWYAWIPVQMVAANDTPLSLSGAAILCCIYFFLLRQFDYSLSLFMAQIAVIFLASGVGFLVLIQAQETVAAMLGLGFAWLALNAYFALVMLTIRSDRQAARLAAERTAQANKMEALGKVVSGVAHDFNNILAITLGAAELLKDATDEERDALSDQIVKVAERGSALSGQLLAFGRSSILEPEPHDVSEIFDEVTLMFDRLLPKTIAQATFVAPDIPGIMVDRSQLEAALLNLAINARDAMPKGGTLEIRAELAASLPENLTQAEPDQSFVCISVRDTGQGIPKDIQADVFDPFFTTKPVGEGTGLGLSMVLGFAQQSGGTVTLDSRLGLGSCVRVYLPASACQTVHHLTRPLQQNGGRGAHVLLVEDEIALRQVLSRQLQAAGYSVVDTANGHEAERVLRAGYHPDVMVTDIVMPGTVQGLELARIARDCISDLPIVLVSGYPDPVSDDEQLAGSLVVLRKPVRATELQAAIHKSIDLTRARTLAS